MTGLSPDSPLLLVGDIVDGLDVDEWTDALNAVGWSGTVEVHQHPGRSGDLLLPGGNHEPLDPAFALGGTDAIGLEVVVIGLGRSGPVAQLVSLGGRAGAVVVVDGLGGPFVEPHRQIEATFAMVRAAMADERSHDVPAPGEVDRRLAHGLVPHGDRRTAQRMIEVMPVPMLVIESAASNVPSAIAREITAAGPSVALHEVETATAHVVAGLIVEWVA